MFGIKRLSRGEEFLTSKGTYWRAFDDTGGNLYMVKDKVICEIRLRVLRTLSSESERYSIILHKFSEEELQNITIMKLSN